MSEAAIIAILSTLSSILAILVIAFVKSYFNLNVKITEIYTEVASIKREIDEHKTSNNNSFDNVAKVLDRWVQLSDSVNQNSERICNIRREMDEHKLSNDKSFEVVMGALKEIKSDNKEEHNKMFQFIGENQKQMTDLIITKLNSK